MPLHSRVGAHSGVARGHLSNHDAHHHHGHEQTAHKPVAKTKKQQFEDNGRNKSLFRISDSPAVWQWWHKSGWRDYTQDASEKIESYFAKGESKVRFRAGKDGKTPMVIFFADMVQFDPVTQNLREVRRTGPDTMMTQLARGGKAYFRSLESGKKHEAVNQFLERRERIWRTADDLRAEFDPEIDFLGNNIAARIVRSGIFFVISTMLVLSNAVWIAYETDYNDAEILSDADIGFQIVEHGFCAAFTLELCIRLPAYKNWRCVWIDLWFRFDVFLVSLMIIETWLIPLISAEGGGDFLGNLSILRLMRLLRLSRMTRVLRAVPEVLTLIKGLITAVRSVFLTLVLMAAIVFLFAVIFKTDAAENPELAETYFSSIPHAMGSLMLHGILLDGVASVCQLLWAAKSPYLKVMVFLGFIFVTTFTVLNMLIGILCEVVAAVGRREQERADIAFLKNNLLDFLELYDQDKDRSITQKELMHILKNPDVYHVLNKFGTDLVGLTTLVDVLFEDKQLHMYQQRIREAEATCHAEDSMDIDDRSIISVTKSSLNMMAPSPSLSFGEVLDVVIRLRGGNAATVTDIVELRKFTAKLFEGVQAQMRRLDNARAKTLRMQPTPEEVHSHCEALQDACDKTNALVRQVNETPLGLATGKPELVKVSLRYESGHEIWRLHRATTTVDHMLQQLELPEGALEARRRSKGFFFQGPTVDREAPLSTLVNAKKQLFLDVLQVGHDDADLASSETA